MLSPLFEPSTRVRGAVTERQLAAGGFPPSHPTPSRPAALPPPALAQAWADRQRSMRHGLRLPVPDLSFPYLTTLDSPLQRSKARTAPQAEAEGGAVQAVFRARSAPLVRIRYAEESTVGTLHKARPRSVFRRTNGSESDARRAPWKVRGNRVAVGDG